MRCPRCSSENPPEYRFCGMCGTPLDKAGEGSVRSAEPPAANERMRPTEPAPQPPQSVSGPSFLGLSGPARGTEDVTYLFDEEQPTRTYWRFVLLLLILGVVGGLAWLRYTGSGRSWLASWVNQRPTAPVQAVQQPPPATAPGQAVQQPPPPTTPAQNSAPPQQPSAGTPANGQVGAQNPPANPPKETDLTPGTTQSAGSSPGQATANQESNASQGQPSSKNQPSTNAVEAASKPPEPSPAEANAAKNETSTDQPDTGEEAPAAKEKPARVKPAPTPTVNPDDALVENAEKYLYGRGVSQNCDRALVSLRAAAGRENARARSLLGTMYATGHCVAKDLPNAYRWFALASRQQSDNMWIQRNLEMIWREMTPQERQLAMQTNR